MSSGNITRDLMHKIGRDIVSENFIAGDSLMAEAEIAEFHGVSRTVTREAMKMLAAKGLVKSWPRRGTIIQQEDNWSLLDPDVLCWMLDRDVSVKLVIDFLNMRLAIEPAAAEMAASKKADVSELKKALEMMVRASNGDGDNLLADCKFHSSILKASDNRFFAQMAPLIETALRITIRLTNQIKGVRRANIADHEAILQAISDGDAAKSRSLTQNHIEAALVLVKSAYPDGVIK